MLKQYNCMKSNYLNVLNPLSFNMAIIEAA
jgi:hypothetical protein